MQPKLLLMQHATLCAVLCRMHSASAEGLLYRNKRVHRSNKKARATFTFLIRPVVCISNFLYIVGHFFIIEKFTFVFKEAASINIYIIILQAHSMFINSYTCLTEWVESSHMLIFKRINVGSWDAYPTLDYYGCLVLLPWFGWRTISVVTVTTAVPGKACNQGRGFD